MLRYIFIVALVSSFLISCKTKIEEAKKPNVVFFLIDDLGWKAVAEETRRVVDDSPVYLTFDIDGLDPAYACGTGTPEPGGITMREAQRMLRQLRGLNYIGGDMVEVAPSLDPSGVTALNGATILFEMLCLMAEKIAKK